MKPSRLKPAPPPSRPAAPWRQALGARARRDGGDAEWIAALWLMVKGYQILAFRLRTRAGEIDILARRRGVVAVVEVKRRATLDLAVQAVDPRRRARLTAAGRAVVQARPALAALELRLDVVALAPGRFPRHLRGL